MCGIAGFITKDNASEKVIKKMTDRIAYRGPDSEGFFIEGGCALGHRRLSIIDIEGGSQPMFDDTKNLVVIFNGEIYNFKELKKELEACGHTFCTRSDTEVLIHGFKEWKKDVVLKLRGMYAFAIWDRSNKSLFMARDKWGIKPLYYYQNGDTFMFASEIKAFLDHPDFKKELNEEILSAYLCFNSTPTEETFFKGVFRLEPGCILSYAQGRINIERFFKIDLEEKEADEDMLADEIHEAMKDSVEHHKIADVEVGAFLSSGIDSSYLVALAKPEKTFTVGYSDPRYDEISYAKDLAEKLGIENISKEIKKEEYIKEFPNIMYHMDEPLADPAAIALYFVAKCAAESVKVVTSGEGADELFGGYLSYHEEIESDPYMKIPFSIRHLLSKAAEKFPEFPGRNFIYRRGQKLEDIYIGLGRVFSDKEAVSILKNKNQISTKDITMPYYSENKEKSDMIKRQTIDYYFWLVRDFLHAVDRNTMMFSLEARTPYLDDAVYEVARKIPLYAKINKDTTKPALRQAAKKVIPNESYKKKKLGFPVPLREWMKEEPLHEMIKEKFNGAVAKKYFEVEKINKLLKQQKDGTKDNYKKVWAIYTFIIWYEQFFEISA